MAYCKQCGAELIEGSKYCEVCGAPTRLATAPTADQPGTQPQPQAYAPAVPQIVPPLQPGTQPQPYDSAPSQAMPPAQPYASSPLQATPPVHSQPYAPVPAQEVPPAQPVVQSQPHTSAQFAEPQPYVPAPIQEVPTSQPQPSQPAAQGMAHQLPGSEIVVDENGAYRWVYEYSLWRDPTVFMTILKVFGGVALGIIAFSMVIDLISGDWGYVDLGDRLRFAAIILGVSFGLAVLGYAIFALISGGSYCVMFTMDETSVENRPLAKELKRAEAIGALNVLLGLATRNVSQVGIGMLAAGGNVMVSDFANVRSIQGYPRRGVIKVNEPLAKNQVYVEKEDYDWVYAFIRDHCPRAKER